MSIVTRAAAGERQYVSRTKSQGETFVLFTPVKSVEAARIAIRESASGFFVLAAFQTAGGVILRTPSLILDGLVFVVLASWMAWRSSRLAAMLMLVQAGAIVTTTIVNRLGGGFAGGSNVILALVALWAALRAVVATFRLPKLVQIEALSVNEGVVRSE